LVRRCAVNKKLSISLAGVVLLTLLGSPVAALADDENQPPVYPSNVQIHQEDSDDHEDEDDGDDDEDDDDDDHKKGWIPPVFVVPGKKHEHHKPKPGSTSVVPTPGNSTDDDDDTTAGVAGTSSINGMDANDFVVVGVEDTEAAKSLESVNLKRSQPVAIEQVRVTTQTPADRFMDTAYLGIGLMALSALGLGATTAVRSYRLRKSGKSDYFYDN
jgi:hypothetical protein